MTLRDLAVLSIKISGIVLFVLVVSRLPEYLKSYLSDESSMGMAKFWIYFIPLLIPGVIAVFLFKFPMIIADQVVYGGGDVSKDEIDFDRLELMLIRILGLLLCFYAVSDLVFHLVNMFQLSRGSLFESSLSSYNYAYLLATGAEFAFAFWLLLGARSVVKLLDIVRQ